ncbi:DUF3943 domain-containing protein [Mucilaginibacter sp. BT774]|uniref:DUF3943 domain-containing protein n=1 Tax=Mucilaginibacter sp. BT774 TaxID=3062276 RepID=UPI0026776402|nr:DUF3943 domain-containing protein [Mucilaginibacter sp. BT774]MDO3624604.1 DUF3943 domain-containing protein [Mucilaginibacter sp. BT774]
MISIYVPLAVVIYILLLYRIPNRLSRIMIFVFLFVTFILNNVSAQKTTTHLDTIVPGKGTPKQQIKQFKQIKKQQLSDSTGKNEPAKSPLVDTTVKNKYGDLLNDDIKFNQKYPAWKPAVEVVGINVFVWSLDRLALNESYSHISPTTWKYNIQKGWEWDDDRFGINFVGHPYTGSLYFNAARSQGYNYLQSFPYAVAGSLMWEYFGENTRPSYNDIINTPVNGAFLGEIFYRVSSNILDDRISGGNRTFREIAAGIINPVRGLNRLLEGKTFRHTKTQVYQQEPLNVTVSGGIHKINQDNKTIFGAGPTNAMINVQLDYGNPFEIRKRKPFDIFRFKTEFSFGTGRKMLDNILGYGLLFGKSTNWGKLSVLYGAFQYYDYWDNKTFELGALGFGGGLITKYPITKTIDLFTNIHIAGVPLAGNSTRYGPDSTQVRDYTYNNGVEAKFEARLNIGTIVSTSLSYYYYILHTFDGPPGNNYVAILRPRVDVRLYKNLSIGFEHFQYYDDRYLKNYPAIFSDRTEQKIFLTYFFKDSQRKEEYNAY